MGNLFGKKDRPKSAPQKSRVTEQDKAVLVSTGFSELLDIATVVFKRAANQDFSHIFKALFVKSIFSIFLSSISIFR